MIRKLSPVINTTVTRPPQGSVERLGRPGEEQRARDTEQGGVPRSAPSSGAPLPPPPAATSSVRLLGAGSHPVKPTHTAFPPHKPCTLCCEDLPPGAAHPFPPRMETRGDAEVLPCGGAGKAGRAVISEMTRGPAESPGLRGRSTGFQSRLCPDVHGALGNQVPSQLHAPGLSKVGNHLACVGILQIKVSHG